MVNNVVNAAIFFPAIKVKMCYNTIQYNKSLMIKLTKRSFFYRATAYSVMLSARQAYAIVRLSVCPSYKNG